MARNIVLVTVICVFTAIGAYIFCNEDRDKQPSSSIEKPPPMLNGKNLDPITTDLHEPSKMPEATDPSIRIEPLAASTTFSVYNGGGDETTVQAVAREKTPSSFRIPVLYYHSVANKPGYGTVIPPEKLEEQMAYLAKEGYRALNMGGFTEIWEGREKAPDKSVLITFDDGYTDNYTEAMHILKKYGFTAVLFIMPGWVGKEGYLNWEQIKEMRHAGWDIYPHSMTHTALSTLSKQQQSTEIVDSRKEIEEHLDTTADVFCYPYGSYNKETLNILKENGFRFAFTIEQGHVQHSQNPLLLKRLYINGQEDMKIFIKKLN